MGCDPLFACDTLERRKASKKADSEIGKYYKRKVGQEPVDNEPDNQEAVVQEPVDDALSETGEESDNSVYDDPTGDLDGGNQLVWQAAMNAHQQAAAAAGPPGAATR